MVGWLQGGKKKSKQTTLTSPPRKKVKTEDGKKSDSKSTGEKSASLIAALAAATASNEALKSKSSADKKMVVKQPIVEDTEISGWDSGSNSRPPEPHTCFAPLPYDCVNAVFTVYDFVTTYGHAIFKVVCAVLCCVVLPASSAGRSVWNRARINSYARCLCACVIATAEGNESHITGRSDRLLMRTV